MSLVSRRLDKKEEKEHVVVSPGPIVHMVEEPPPLLPGCTRERSLGVLAILIFIMVFTLQTFGRNSPDAWYSSTYMTLDEALSNDCAMKLHEEHAEEFWRAHARMLTEKEDSEKHTEDEYLFVTDIIRNCTAPCHVLVFGVNWDALLITEANRGGNTVFLEDNDKWQRMVRGKIPCMESFTVNYMTRLRDWPLYTEPKNMGELKMVLPLPVVTSPWDVIVVRGPAGASHRWGVLDPPGRMQSLYMARELARQAFLYNHRKVVDVVVYDVDREVEDRYATLLFGGAKSTSKSTKKRVGNIAHYALTNGFHLELE